MLQLGFSRVWVWLTKIWLSLKSEKQTEFCKKIYLALNLGWNYVLNIAIRSFFWSKKYGQFGQNVVKRLKEFHSQGFTFSLKQI
jgi:hypothetical protein